MVDRQDGAWRRRPVLSALVRVVQYGIPLAVGWAAARAVRGLLAGHVDALWVAVAAISTAVGVSLLASRLTMRLAPLALLLRMTMVFPDRAPSRLKVARRSTSAAEIRRLLDGDDTSAHEAAVTMLSLVTALSQHDKKTRGHGERVRLFCDLLSEEIGLAEPDRSRLRWAALIHDIGKLEVSADILNKPGTLTDREWQVVRAHPATGAQIARPLADWLGPWYPGIIQHHERYDGTGYPMGLAGEQISLAGRVISVVDAFETMTAARSYKAARTLLAARAELTRCAGTHFDPSLVRAFLGVALPRLLWAVGPLAFLLNAPLLRWLGDGGARIVDLTGATAQAAVTTAGVTAVVATSGVASTPAVPASVPSRPAHSTPAPSRSVEPAARATTRSQPAPTAVSPSSPSSPAVTAQPGTSTRSSSPRASSRAEHSRGHGDHARRDQEKSGRGKSDAAKSGRDKSDAVKSGRGRGSGQGPGQGSGQGSGQGRGHGGSRTAAPSVTPKPQPRPSTKPPSAEPRQGGGQQPVRPKPPGKP